jgi:hypothetical protein
MNERVWKGGENIIYEQGFNEFIGEIFERIQSFNVNSMFIERKRYTPVAPPILVNFLGAPYGELGIAYTP